ncbi:hypothetical protein MCEMSEM23_02296 [Rhabdaerophilaceae bacterium]
MRGLLLFSVFFWLFGFHSVVSAQSTAPAKLLLAGGQLLERLEGGAAVPVSGNLLAGVQIGGSLGKFNPNSIQVSISDPPSAKNSICLSVASRDGRYSAKNVFHSAPKPGITEFDFQSRFRKELMNYDDNLIAILVRESENCEGTDFGFVLPRIVSNSAGANSLLVAVNAAAERTSVALLRDGAEIAKSACKADKTKVSMAFSAVCRFDEASALRSGEYVLDIRIRERFEIVSRQYSLRLP